MKCLEDKSQTVLGIKSSGTSNVEKMLSPCIPGHSRAPVHLFHQFPPMMHSPQQPSSWPPVWGTPCCSPASLSGLHSWGQTNTSGFNRLDNILISFDRSLDGTMNNDCNGEFLPNSFTISSVKALHRARSSGDTECLQQQLMALLKSTEWHFYDTDNFIQTYICLRHNISQLCYHSFSFKWQVTITSPGVRWP